MATGWVGFSTHAERIGERENGGGRVSFNLDNSVWNPLKGAENMSHKSVGAGCHGPRVALAVPLQKPTPRTRLSPPPPGSSTPRAGHYFYLSSDIIAFRVLLCFLTVDFNQVYPTFARNYFSAFT